MGVDYNPVLALGQEFEDAGECVEFVKHLLTQDELDEIEDDGNGYITEVAYYRKDGGFPEVQCLDLYNGYGYYVGYKISCRSVEAFEKSLKDAQQSWEKNFPGEKAEIIHTVRIS